MPSINLRQASLAAPGMLFQDVSLILSGADRLGLVAGNGGGKTTLLRCIAGQAELTGGDITHSRGLRIGFVEQDVPGTLLGLPFAEAIRRAIPPAGRDAEAWRVGALLDEFEAPDAIRGLPIHALSGGWQRLALIARAAVADPDALLLDEPTNHLDLAKIEWLERWIGSHPALMVIASHDRRFLDRCTNRTLFLRPGQSRCFAHPYSTARRLLAEGDSADAAKLTRDTREVDRLRRSAGELKNIGINSRSDKAQRKSMLMTQRAEALEQTLRPAAVDKSGLVRLASRGTHARVVMTIDDLCVQAPDGRMLFRTGKLKVFAGDRVVILGRNGVGKSRLLHLVRQAAGQGGVPGVQVSPAAVPGVVDQAMAHLPGGTSPFDFIAAGYRLGDARSRSLLAGAGFAVERQHHPVERLSPGQKARLGLLALRLAEPNLYILDEPTNHVDIAGQEALEAEINAQDATGLIVSHDRSFVAAVGTRYWLIEAGQLREMEAPG